MTTANQLIKSLIDKYISGQATTNDMQLISEWLNTSTTNKSVFFELIKQSQPIKGECLKDDWQHFQNKFKTQLYRTNKKKRYIGFLPFAACVSIVIAMSIHLLTQRTNKHLQSYLLSKDNSINHRNLNQYKGTSLHVKKSDSDIKADLKQRIFYKTIT